MHKPNDYEKATIVDFDRKRIKKVETMEKLYLQTLIS